MHQSLTPRSRRVFVLRVVSINVGILLGFAVDHVVNVSFPNNIEFRWRLSMGLSMVA